MTLEISISARSEEITPDLIEAIEQSAAAILNNFRRERASRTVPATARLGSMPYRPQPGSSDTNPAAVSIGKDASGRIGTV